jgi:hypothetical protein
MTASLAQAIFYGIILLELSKFPKNKCFPGELLGNPTIQRIELPKRY